MGLQETNMQSEWLAVNSPGCSEYQTLSALLERFRTSSNGASESSRFAGLPATTAVPRSVPFRLEAESSSPPQPDLFLSAISTQLRI